MSVDLQPGAVFAGDFRVIRPLSEGGMGAVYVVEQLSTGAQRALKLMRRELVADASLRDRFLQEARVGSRIASDHVVQVIAAGIEPSYNLPWLVMELLSGEELADRVRRAGPLPRADVAEVAKQLAHALAAAHAVGVVHRDLKPNNLYLAASRTAGAPFSLKVLDFGIAKIVADAKTTGTVGLGTPLWMAPEQTEAKSYVGPGTDVWAFGLIMFYVLTGKSFWLAAAQANTGIQTLLREILFEPIVPPSRRAAELGCGHLIPEGFDAWFLRCVERDPQKREASVERALAGLLAVLGAAPAQPMPRAGATQLAEPLPFAQSGPAPAHTPPTHPAHPAASYAGPTPPGGQPPTIQSGPPYMSQPYGPTPAPLVATPPGPAAPRRSALGAILGIGAVVLLGGGVAAYLAFGADDKKKSKSDRRRSSSDDDDDDDDGSRKKKPVADLKAEDCAELKRLIDKAEADTNVIDEDETLDDNSRPDALAKVLDKLVADVKATEMKTADGRGLASRYVQVLQDISSAAKNVAAASRRGDIATALSESSKLEKIVAEGQKVEEDAAQLCGWATGL